MTETNVKEPVVENNQPKGPKQQKYTAEEMKKMRDDMIKHYKGEITFLKVQADYENLLANVEESKARRYMAMAQVAQLFAGVEDEQEKENLGKKKSAN